MSKSIPENLGLDVSRETLECLQSYVDLVTKWNPAINLIARGEEVWDRHILDSAQLFSLLPSTDIILADLGSGAGFPGMVLAILGVKEVHLVDSDQRKMTFLREAARVTNTHPTFHVKRIEDIFLPKCDVITARALASLAQLLDYASPHVHENTLCLFLKGRNWRIECEEAQRDWMFDIEVKPSVTADDAVILAIRNLVRKTHEHRD